MNSIRNVKRAIDVEANRLIEIIEAGGTIQQQTRSFDANAGTTQAIRDKEDADDYRYFPEPDLTPFHLQDEFIENKEKYSSFARGKNKKYTTELSLSGYDASVLTEERTVSDYFEK